MTTEPALAWPPAGGLGVAPGENTAAGARDKGSSFLDLNIITHKESQANGRDSAARPVALKPQTRHLGQITGTGHP
jgi:hypothetical protein